jgi:excisionase family DNA binding protein
VNEALRQITLLTPQEVADCLRVSRSWVYTAVREGRLGGVKVGGRLRIRVEHVDDFLERNAVHTHRKRMRLDEIAATVR